MKNQLWIIVLSMTLCSPVAADEALNIGKRALERNDYGTAMRVFLPAANDGNAEAQALIGYLHEEGLGVKQSYSDAVTWYQKAGDNGSAKAQHNLGILYFNGIGVEKDIVSAYQWFLKAAEQGLIFMNSQAMTRRLLLALR